MILHRLLNRKLSSLGSLIVVVATTLAFPVSFLPAADEPAATDPATVPTELPRSGVLEVAITANGASTTAKSLARALSRLESIGKAAARRPDAASRLFVSINVNETTREFTDLEDALRVVKGLKQIIDAAKKSKIQLGELGRLDDAATQSQQTATDSQPTGRQQPFRPVRARDGEDGFGVGGGLGGAGGGGIGLASRTLELELAALRRAGERARPLQIALLRQRLRQLLAAPAEQVSSTPGSTPAPKEMKLGEATLFARMLHRDYQKATFSFEFGVRDDPAYQHANDWDLQYGNGGNHFHVTMVSDDRSRIIDLGKMDWEQLDTTRLARLPPHPQPRREFVPTAEGHLYMVHTVDRNSDLYALFRVEAVDQRQGKCDITWRVVDAPN